MGNRDRPQGKAPGVAVDDSSRIGKKARTTEGSGRLHSLPSTEVGQSTNKEIGKSTSAVD